MKFLYFIIFVVISVTAYKDNFSFDDHASKFVNISVAPYFVLNDNIVEYGRNRFILGYQNEFSKHIEDLRFFFDPQHNNDISRRMVLVKVDSAFNSHILITLPDPNAEVPERVGYIFTRILYETRISYYALIRRRFPSTAPLYPNETQEYHKNDSMMFHTDVTTEQGFTLPGSPFVIDGTLYGMITVQVGRLQNDEEQAHMSLLNIPQVLQKLIAVLG